MIERLASGDWIEARRVRFVCTALLVATVATAAGLVLTGHGTLDAMGRPIGTDFSDVYAAGWMARHGAAAQAWIWPLHYRVQQAIHHSAAVPFYGWHYPPPFLLMAAALSTLPYLWALAMWQAATLAAAAATLRRIAPGPGPGTLLAVLASPATFVCLGHGQNAFLTAALLGGGMTLLDRRPLAAGLLLGCLVYKPQFAVLVPVAIVAAGSPRAFLGAALSSATLIAASLALWGWPVWAAFLHSLPITRHVVIETGETGWEKIVSAFAAARALGAGLPLAYAVQGTASALAMLAAAVAGRWATPRVRGAVTAAAALLSTPYVLDYDLTLAGVAIAFLVADGRARGWLRWEKTVLACAYLVPLAGRQIAAATLVPVDWIAVVALMLVAARRFVVLDRAGLRSSPFRRSHAASGR